MHLETIVISVFRTRIDILSLTSKWHVSSDSKRTMGCPPDSTSVRFCGRNRATTLILLDMIARIPWSSNQFAGEEENQVKSRPTLESCSFI